MTSRTAVLQAAGGLAAALVCAAVVSGCAGDPPEGNDNPPGTSGDLPGSEYANFDGEYLTDGGERRYEVMTINEWDITYAVFGCDGEPLVNTGDVTGDLDILQETITWTNPDGSTQTVDYSVRGGDEFVEIQLAGEPHGFHSAGSENAQRILNAHAAECANG
ncbi:hypothetical protein GCM10027591_08530 [Zhihengliuella somnathii]